MSGEMAVLEAEFHYFKNQTVIHSSLDILAMIAVLQSVSKLRNLHSMSIPVQLPLLTKLLVWVVMERMVLWSVPRNGALITIEW